MSAPNFYKKNAENYFIIEDNRLMSDFDIDFLREDLLSELKKEFKRFKKIKFYVGDLISKDYKDNRTYPLYPLIELTYNYGFSFIIGLRNGYYYDNNLDYEIIRDEDEVLTKKEEAIINRIEQGLNKVFNKICDYALTLKGVFSNGEAIYEKIKKDYGVMRE